MQDIPGGINQSFLKIFVPRLLEWVGTQRPWHSQTHEEVVELWNVVFPGKPLENSDVKEVVVKIVSWAVGVVTVGV